MLFLTGKLARRKSDETIVRDVREQTEWVESRRFRLENNKWSESKLSGVGEPITDSGMVYILMALA